MNLRIISRVSAVLAVVCLAAGTVVAVMAPGASALAQDRITLTPGAAFQKDFSPLIGDNPGANVDASTTINDDTCATTTCDVIPLTIPAPPNDDDFFVSITLEWDTAQIPNVPVLGTTAVNDLDLWVTNDPVVDGAGPDNDGFTYKSAGASEPEFIQMYKPTGNWKIYVTNASGVNTGYRLKFTWTTDPIPTIFESFPPEFSAGSPVARPKAAVTPTPLPAAPSYTPPAAPAAAPVAPVAPTAAPRLALDTPAVPDASFAANARPTGGLDAELAGPPAQNAVPASIVKPRPPSTIAIVLWLLALPLVALAVVAGILTRRRSAALPI